ncbi:hydrogenase maturation nickel metallochaperone HypA [Bacillus sp. CMF12]|uniref:hydrogenase maturation nickel metallochaperone HypA/HybF n=1 Tax=Bacillus sp. CMF12 TaxID=2884834 RepID=UPI00207ABD54|nr:hydrogenase maturation nickel metallochaperone HypA [Bacillus sp. CMF12]USK52122.1 hydrogenase maturation nickel metallochaperone HypA [Bacillus sp. CMF12]
MHEMSLMADILYIVEADAIERGFVKINRISVIVGELSNVLPDALELAFSFFQKQEDNLISEKTELKIIREVAKARCKECGKEFTPDYRIALCPHCNQINTEIISGESFQVESYEGSERFED